MQRVCFLLKVNKDMLEDYKRDHQAVDSGMLRALSEAGVHNYSLFLRDDGMLIGYLEAENPKEALRQVSSTEANAVWQEKMLKYFEGGSGDMDKGSMEWVEQIFY